jgi:hypothetical protein
MKAATLLLLLLLGGCSPWRVSEPGTRVDLGLYSVDPQIVWNMTSFDRGEGWTVDGWTLHSLSFIKGLKDGQVLWASLQDTPNAPVFNKDMTPHEIAEFIAGSLSLQGAKKVKTAGLKPQAFGKLSGFRFDLEYADESDLEVQGLVTGVVHDGRLHLILYRGAKEYYFPKYREPVEKMIASIRLAE